MWLRRSFDAEAARLVESPILLGGDADDLLTTLRDDARSSGIPVTSAEESTEPARVVILAVDGDGRRSAFTKAARMLRDLEGALTSDAVRLVVIRSGRARLAPDRMLRILAPELYFQITMTLPGQHPERRSRSFRQSLGLAALEAAGLRVLRFG